MIKGIHALFYSSEPEALRTFLRDKLQLPYSDVGDGWLIFDLPEADMGCHPADGKDLSSGRHQIAFYCDNIYQTVSELKSRGVEFDDEITDTGWGLSTYFTMPGHVRVQLYEPRYEKQAGI